MKKCIFNRVWGGLLLALVGTAFAPASAWWDSCGSPGCELGLEASAEFLWWNVSHSDDLLIGFKDKTNTSGSSTGQTIANITNARTQTFKFQYKPGFRVNLAWHLPCSDWTVGTSYTYFHFHHHNTITAPPGGIIWASTWPITPTLQSAAADEARAIDRVRYDLIDLIATKTTTCDGITNSFYGGVRSLIFDERFTVSYDFDETLIGIIEPGQAVWDAYMPAVGITAGYDGIYKICRGWGIRGRLGASLLAGRVKHYQHWTFSPGAAAVIEKQNKGHHGQVIWGWDAALGINYDTCWCCRPVTLAFGYEIYDWMNMPRQRYFPSVDYPGVATTDETGHFTAHGAYVRLGTSF